MHFALFDIDVFSGQFVDRLSIVGYFNGALVGPVLTHSVANTVSGFTATGIATADNATADGNVTITFQQPVDHVVITYGSSPGAPAAPGHQGISLHDLTYCLGSAELAASKTVAVHDPTTAELDAISGNDGVYAITVSNTGSGVVDSNAIFLVDALPGELEFFNGDFDGAGPGTGAIGFTQSSAALSFSEASDALYSNAGFPPANFADCSHRPAAGYDPAVRYICVNPKGSMAGGDPDPTFTVRFRARIK